MNYRILTKPLSAFEALGDVSVQEGTTKILVYGDFVPNSNGKGGYRGPDQVEATLEDLGGKYMVFADEATLTELDPTNVGEKISDIGTDYLVYRISGTELIDETPVLFTNRVHEFKPGTVPSKPPTEIIPWVIGNLTITSATPTVKSTIGGIDMPDIVDKNPIKIVL